MAKREAFSTWARSSPGRKTLSRASISRYRLSTCAAPPATSSGACTSWVGSEDIKKTGGADRRLSPVYQWPVNRDRAACALLPRRGGGNGGRHAGLQLAHVERLLHPQIGLTDIGLVILGRCRQVGAFAIEQVEIGHRVIVLVVDLERVIQVPDAGVDHVPILGAQLFAGLLVLQRAGVLGLHSGLGSRDAESGIPLRPRNHAQAVVGGLVLLVEVGQPLIPGLGLVQLRNLLIEVFDALGLAVV